MKLLWSPKNHIRPVATFCSDPDLYGSISIPDQTKGRNGTRRHESGLRSGRADRPVHWRDAKLITTSPCWNLFHLLQNILVPTLWILRSNVTMEFSLNFCEKIISTYSLLCRRPRCYHTTNKTNVTDRIFKLTPIEASMTCKIPRIDWIQWRFSPI